MYERAFTSDGKAYHHIIDPRTGFPAESDVVSATVVSHTSLEGDGYSTSLILMGVEGALQFAAQHPEICLLYTSYSLNSGVANQYDVSAGV